MRSWAKFVKDWKREQGIAPEDGWIYALAAMLHDSENPVVKVGKTCLRNPGDRAARILFDPFARPALDGPATLFACRSDDIVTDEKMAHRALETYRFHERRRDVITSDYPFFIGRNKQVTRWVRWLNVSGKELYICSVEKAVEVIVAVTGQEARTVPIPSEIFMTFARGLTSSLSDEFPMHIPYRN